MYDIIIDVTKDKSGFIQVDEHQLIIVSDVQDASKFKRYGDASDCVLKKAREVFKDRKFIINGCPKSIFGNKPRQVVTEEVILNDSYFHSDWY